MFELTGKRFLQDDLEKLGSVDVLEGDIETNGRRAIEIGVQCLCKDIGGIDNKL